MGWVSILCEYIKILATPKNYDHFWCLTRELNHKHFYSYDMTIWIVNLFAKEPKALCFPCPCTQKVRLIGSKL